MDSGFGKRKRKYLAIVFDIISTSSETTY